MTWTERYLRSPLTTAWLFAVLGGLMTITAYPEELPAWLVAWGRWTGYLILGGWGAVFIVHNIRNPGRRIRFFYFIPLELREEDEGLQWITYRACRKLYIFLSFAIPLAAAAVAIFKEPPYLPILVIAWLGIVPCLLYWIELRRWQRQSQL